MFPNYSQFLGQYWGYGPEVIGSLGAASNIVVGTNPPYTSEQFLAFYPKFAAILTLPPVVLNAYIALASASLVQARWGAKMWPVAMGWFVAHFCTLYLRSDGDATVSSAGQVAASGLAQGIATSQSAGPVSVGITQAGGLEAWGGWAQTEYGVQLVDHSKIVGAGPMLIY